MGGVARIRLALYHWPKEISLAHGLSHLYIFLKAMADFLI